MFCHIFSESNRVDVNAEKLKLYLSVLILLKKKTTEREELITWPSGTLWLVF